ncbi:MAG: shikimate dehydrogenase [Bacteroidales bacterium]|jgi:shikimate dehydrogenase|nr:shikimate dehydrogenase [Bacteroidales bacterium]
MKKPFGIIGYPLTISCSQGYFRKKFEQENLADHSYERFPLADISEFPELLKTHDFCGLNVTFPYKKAVIPYLHGLDESAAEAGAVNVIKFEKDGRLTGHNSDVYGFEQSFLPLLKPHHRSALILGTGGAAAAVASILRKHNMPHQFVSRQKTAEALTYPDLHQNGFGDATVLINCTPLGMTPNTDTCVDLPYEKITAQFLCFDLVYSPDETLFLQRSKAQGAAIKNGLEMLDLQAVRAWEIWKC